MDAGVAPTLDYSNNERVITRGIDMTQDRWPIVTTSVSGVSKDDWDLFKKTAKRRKLNYRQAMERSIAELIADVRSSRDISWEPSRPAKSRPIKIHVDTIEEVRKLADQVGYRQNVIILTAMLRWVSNPKSTRSTPDRDELGKD